MGMSLFCRIGLHRWSFNTQLRDEPGRRVYTELISARCSRDRCARYGSWNLVHREAHVAGTPPNDSQARAAEHTPGAFGGATLIRATRFQ